MIDKFLLPIIVLLVLLVGFLYFKNERLEQKNIVLQNRLVSCDNAILQAQITHETQVKKLEAVETDLKKGAAKKRKQIDDIQNATVSTGCEKAIEYGVNVALKTQWGNDY